MEIVFTASVSLMVRTKHYCTMMRWHCCDLAPNKQCLILWPRWTVHCNDGVSCPLVDTMLVSPVPCWTMWMDFTGGSVRQFCKETMKTTSAHPTNYSTRNFCKISRLPNQYMHQAIMIFRKLFSECVFVGLWV